MFGVKPKTLYHSPFEKGDHAEIDNSKFLLSDDIEKYQSLIRAMQWFISLRCIDITTDRMLSKLRGDGQIKSFH